MDRILIAIIVIGSIGAVLAALGIIGEVQGNRTSMRMVERTNFDDDRTSNP
jgi:hypothetical protein